MTAAQIVLALLVVVAGIHVTRLLHDAVPSTVRAGVASGVGALSWIAFLPFALVFGVVSKHRGVHAAGWMITAATVLAGLADPDQSRPPQATRSEPAPVVTAAAVLEPVS